MHLALTDAPSSLAAWPNPRVVFGRSSGRLWRKAPRSRAAARPPRDPRQTELFRTVFVPPCKPTLRPRLPVGLLWRYEIKYDVYRA
jgi:ATP-dependent DNA ligase